MTEDAIYRAFRRSTGVSTDSRSIRPGDLFFALKGPSFNGNRFASAALDAGAVAAVIDDSSYSSEGTIMTDDSLVALQQLAGRVRDNINARVIAITGTNGKTTTRELFAAVLSKRFTLCASQRNLNNQIGLPLTMVNANPDSEVIVVEMGAKKEGDIMELCNIARPDTGIITNIGKAHIEGFGSVEAVVRTKSELFRYLGATGGTAFYNEEDSVVSQLAEKYVENLVPYNCTGDIKLITETRRGELMLSGRLISGEREFPFRTNLFGAHNHHNIRAAIAIAISMGMGEDEVLSAIASYNPSNNRSQVMRTATNVVICDSYNANPVSLTSALRSFAGLGGENKVAIIGDMLELGSVASDEHEAVVRLVTDIGPECTLFVGPLFSELALLYGFRGFPDVAELRSYLERSPLRDSTILVKGSNGIGLSAIYDLL